MVHVILERVVGRCCHCEGWSRAWSSGLDGVVDAGSGSGSGCWCWSLRMRTMRGFRCFGGGHCESDAVGGAFGGG